MNHELQFAAVAFAADEQSVNVGGHYFKAVDGEPGKCQGCYFKHGFGCSLWRAHSGSPKCQAKFRDDGRDIIWIGARE